MKLYLPFSSPEAEAFLLGAVLLIVVFIILQRKITCTKTETGCSSRPPKLPGAWPIIGHLIPFYRSPVDFFHTAKAKYGPIFEIQLFSKCFIIIGDTELAQEFYKAPEETLSLNKALDGLMINDIYMERLRKPVGEFVTDQILFLRKNNRSAYPAIESCATNLIDLLKRKDVDLNLGVQHYIISVHTKIFFGLESKPPLEFTTGIRNLKDISHSLVYSAAFLPKRLLNLWIRYKVHPIRDNVGSFLLDEIQKYFDCPTHCNSQLLRLCTDLEVDGPSPLTKMEVKNITLALLSFAGQNSTVALWNAFVDLALNLQWLPRLRSELAQYIYGDRITDLCGILKSEFLDSFLMESVRVNINLFPGSRVPSKGATVSKYRVGYADIVTTCGTLTMADNSVHFKDAKEFHPERYSEWGERKSSRYNFAWGLGEHKCPAKTLTKNAIKACFALVLMNFDVAIENGINPEMDYFILSEFRGYKCNLKLTPWSKVPA